MGSPAVDVDVNSLVSQLTLDEKISILSGKNLWETQEIPRLGIPSLKLSDGPNGARGGTFVGGVRAACFPASVSLAASWDRTLVDKIGKGLAEETKTKGALVLLGPTVCPHRHPLGGRNFESFSEDPLLAGVLASRYITSLQQQGVGATIKHFVANEQESKRFTIDETVSQRALREIYLKPFEIAIKAAKPWALMTSYNLVNGIHSDSNKWLLQTVLRDQWRWDGLVMSDWGGTNSVLESISAGLDIEMPGPGLYRTQEKVSQAVKNKSLPTSDIDHRVRAVLGLLVKTGKFAHPETPAEQAIDLPEHRQLIREAGSQGVVLLKNRNNILPLQIDKYKSIAMLGLAKECLAHGGGSAAVHAHYKRTPWDAMTDTLEGKVELKYAQGANVLRSLPPISTGVYDRDGNPGFTLEGYSSRDKSTAPIVKNVSNGSYRVFEGTKYAAVSLSGTFVPTVSGSHYLAFNAIANTTISINSVPVFSVEGNGVDPMAFVLGVGAEEQIQYPFVAGKAYTINVQSAVPEVNTSGLSMLDNFCGFHFGFMLQEDFERDYIAPAVTAAQNSDLALVFVGRTPSFETEGTDMETMALPASGTLDALVQAVAAVNPRTVVINSTGGPISMPWLDSAGGLLQAWFPGQEAGNSITDVLLGKVNPGGKLPVTFPKNIEACPAYGNFPGDLEALKVEYKEGIFIGYRHFDRHPEDVLFPFGYGLSYTTFSVSKAQIQAPAMLAENLKLTVKASITNTGDLPGSEVLQLYVGPAQELAVEMPVKQLADFVKVWLQPGETKEVSLSLGQENAAYWVEEKQSWVVEAGGYRAYLGTSAVHINDTLSFQVEKGFEFGP